MTTGKRKRLSADLPATKIQTTGLSTPSSCRVQDVLLEDSMSPRTAVSARFQELNLMSSRVLSVPKDPHTAQQSHAAQSVADRTENHNSAEVIQADTYSCFEDFRRSTEVQQSPAQQSTQGSMARSSQNKTAHENSLGFLYQFKGKNSHFSTQSSIPDVEMAAASPTKRLKVDKPRVSSLATPSSLESMKETKSVNARSPEPSLPPSSPPIPRSRSPSAKKLMTPRQGSKPESVHGISTSVFESSSDPDNIALWWQDDEEIIGHDPDDPEDDNRGLNGIGYQKTKAEQSRITERKKKQILEWKTREAREARALRSGKRAMQGVITGRVTKSPSRSGSPVDRRGSPSSGIRRSAENILNMTPVDSPSKGVRFKEQPELERIQIDFGMP